MGVIAVLVAAAAAWAFGATWYMVIGTRWIEASGLDEAEVDRGNPTPYIVSYICVVLVAGMTRHILSMAGIVDAWPATIAGLGLGLFVAAPWVATNVMFSQRDRSLIWMDGVYPAIGTAIIGLVLSWFA
jgi:hypothetical protein